MKKILIIIGLVAGLASCTPFATTVVTNREYERLSDDEDFFIFYKDDQEPPESATLIGEFETEFYLAPKEMLEAAITDEVLSNGGNLVMVGRDRSKKGDVYLNGKVYRYKIDLHSQYTEERLKEIWKNKAPDKLEGIYEIPLKEISGNFRGYKAKYGIVKNSDSTYLLVYLNGFEGQEIFWRINRLEHIWKAGDIAAWLKVTPKPNFYETKLVEYNKYIHVTSAAKYEAGCLIVNSVDGDIYHYKRVYPDTSKYQPVEGSLTGFSIGEGRILTCFHGVNKLDSTKEIQIKGINNSFDTKYRAKLEYFDRDRDLALLKLEQPDLLKDASPFSFASAEKVQGEGVFLVGYPYTSVLGDEIKVTDGIISACSGYAGLQRAYQISAPMHPGNSGSPVFDNDGNMIGILNSGVGRTETIGYSIKLSELNKFLGAHGISPKVRPENAYKSLSLTDKVKQFEQSIFIVEVVDAKKEKENNRYFPDWLSPWDYYKK